MVFQVCFKEVSNMFQGSLKSVSSRFQIVLMRFQGYLREV